MQYSDRTEIRTSGSLEQPRVVTFGPFVFDLAKAELRRDHRVLPAPTLSLRLLAYLLKHRDRLVDRRELVREVWGGVVVSEGSLRQAVWELRQLLDDSAESQRVIRTVRGRGYRFVAALSTPEPAIVRALPRACQPPRAQPFVGRALELRALREALSASIAQSGRACALVGAAGGGKTCLARELARAAVEQGVPVLEVAADPDGAAPAFWPWLHLARGMLSRLEPSARDSLTARHPGALRMLEPARTQAGALEPPDAGSPEQFAAMSELSALLIEAASRTPLLLVIEDLQWADEGTLALTRQLSLLLGHTRALALVTCRAQRTRDNRALARTLESIQRSPNGKKLELSGFSLDEVSELLAWHAREPVSEQLVRKVFDQSQGNALFAAELTRLLTRENEPPLGGGDELPDLARVVERRLLVVPEDVLRLVCAASVLGPEFTLAELSAVAEQPSPQLLALLEQAVTQELLLERGDASFGFVHPLIRQAAHDLLSRRERCRFHALAGAWLETFSLDARGTRLNELAHHFYQAAAEMGGAKAVHYALRCAQLAYEATAYQDAVAHYDRALTCMDLEPSVSLADKLDVALQRAEALRASGTDTTRVNALFRSLAEQAEAIGAVSLFARAVLGYTGQRTLRFTPTRFAASSNDEEIALIERALSVVGAEPSEQRALLLCSLMAALLYSTDKSSRDRAAEEALTIARTLGKPALLVRVLTMRFYCCARLHAPEARRADCDELLQVAAQHKLRPQQIDGLVTRALWHLGRGDVQLAALDEARAKALAQANAPRKSLVRSELLELMRAIWRGDLAEARRRTQCAYEAAPEDLAERALYTMRSSCLQLLETGVLPDSVATYETMLRAFPEAIGLHCALASCHATLGNRAQAELHFEFAARDDFGSLPEHPGWLGEVALLADAAAWLDDGERARRVYAKLEPFSQVFDFFMGEAVPAGPVAHWLSALAIAFRDLPLARRWATAACELNQRLGATMLNQYVVMLSARIEELSGNAALALKLLDDVRAFAEPRRLAWLLNCSTRARERVLAGCLPSTGLVPLGRRSSSG